jgi:heterodisulfide reductase subunit C
VNLETLLLISVVLLSFGYAGYGLLRLMRLLRAQAPVHYPTRNKAPLRYRLVLRKFFFRKDPIHLIFLWGFLTLALDMVGQNLALVSVTLALCYAMYRRYLVRPESLGQSRSANILVGFTASLIVFVFLAKVTHHAAFYWIYRIMILGFIAYLPNSRHLHLLTATPNLFFQSLKKPTPTTASVSGAAKITDLSWKDALDTLSCSECGKCQEACPAHNTLKPLTPKMLMLDLQENFLHQEPTILSKKITEPTIWSCTFCKACEEACPNGIEHTPKILDIRRDITTTKKRVPEELATVYRNLETYGSPWAVSPAARLSWADGLGVKTIKQEKTELLLWVGCAGAFDERYRQTLRSIAKLLKKAGVKFSVLGEEEQCTGDVARRTGNEVLFQKLAKENIQKFNQYGIRKILTACPHCFHTLKNDYPAFG